MNEEDIAWGITAGAAVFGVIVFCLIKNYCCRGGRPAPVHPINPENPTNTGNQISIVVQTNNFFPQSQPVIPPVASGIELMELSSSSLLKEFSLDQSQFSLFAKSRSSTPTRESRMEEGIEQVTEPSLQMPVLPALGES